MAATDSLPRIDFLCLNLQRRKLQCPHSPSIQSLVFFSRLAASRHRIIGIIIAFAYAYAFGIWVVFVSFCLPRRSEGSMHFSKKQVPSDGNSVVFRSSATWSWLWPRLHDFDDLFQYSLLGMFAQATERGSEQGARIAWLFACPVILRLGLGACVFGSCFKKPGACSRVWWAAYCKRKEG